VGAAVLARHIKTGTVVSVQSGYDGYYRLQNLIPGDHVIEIDAPGFRAFKSSPQTVSVAEAMRLDVTMEIGPATESISVEAKATRVNTEDSQLGKRSTRSLACRCCRDRSEGRRSIWCSYRRAPRATSRFHSRAGIFQRPARVFQ
jgi:hypothetical protein